MQEQEAKELIEKVGYVLKDIRTIPEGNNHHVFNVALSSGEEVIAKFEKPPEHDYEERRDVHFDGGLSLEREVNLFRITREKAHLPAPRIQGPFISSGKKFYIAEKMPGRDWIDFLHKNNYSLSSFLQSMEFLGADVAQAHRVSFDRHGDVFDRTDIRPPGVQSFADRLYDLISKKIREAEHLGSLTERELREVECYFRRIAQDVPARSYNLKPVFLLIDLHPRNQLVDENGKVTGYIDLEWCQAGPKSLEHTYNTLTFFYFFDEKTSRKAKEAYFRGYRINGGRYDPLHSENQKLEAIFFAFHSIVCVNAYFGRKDGLRDSWSTRFKEILLKITETSSPDYVASADVFRDKENQPRQPTFP